MSYRVSLTYGVLPTFEQFRSAFESEMGDNTYSIRGPQIQVQGHRALETEYEGDYTLSQLWQLVNTLTVAFNYCSDDESGDLASAILETLNIEWI